MRLLEYGVSFALILRSFNYVTLIKLWYINFHSYSVLLLSCCFMLPGFLLSSLINRNWYYISILFINFISMYYIYSFHHFLSFADFCLHTSKIYSPLIYYIPTTVSFPSSSPCPSHSVLLPDPLLLCFLSKRAGLLDITKHGILSCSKTRHISSYSD